MTTRLQATPQHPASDAPTLRALLRSATAGDHSRLEDTLDLLRPPLLQARFARVLAGFHGFHAVWEPAIAARLQRPAFTAARERLAGTQADLLALGVPAQAIAALPLCSDAVGLCSSLDAALGALYVVEGSTLGGTVIARHLQQAAWCPPGGLRYFSAHGADTGALWRETLACIDGCAQDPQAVALGARQAFQLLQQWLGAALAQPVGTAAALQVAA